MKEQFHRNFKLLTTKTLLEMLEDYFDLKPTFLDYEFCLLYREAILDEIKEREKIWH